MTAAPSKEIKTSLPDTTTMIIAFIVIIVTCVLLYVYKKKKTSRTDILLTGVCESGKSRLYANLVFEDAETFTSIKENIGDYEAKNGYTRLVDIPGHERLRGKFVDEYKGQARGVVYVVDSSTVQKDIRDVADYLYTLLADPALASVPFLILANKQDETMAKSANVIKSLLEKELNLIRSTRMSQLESVDDKANQNVFIGKQGKDLEFAHLSQNIEVTESSIKNKELDNLKDWLDRVV